MKEFRDPRMPLEERVEALLAELTADEKCGFINYRNEGVPRLGIPPYVWWNEALHGLARSGSATVFPQAIAMAATFSPELVRKMGEVIATEGRARHFDARRHGDFGTYKGLTYWSPNVNIYRDPRWGRGQETYGECPFLTGEMGAAYVRGVQGPDPEHPRAAATPKHFAAHSGPEATRLGFNSRVSEKDLRETYLPAFRKCIAAGARSIMSAYNALNGTPCSANDRLLRKILREEWKFTGAVVTDAGTGDAMVRHHRCSPDYPSALAAELHAGVDVVTDWPFGAREALERGLIREEEIDRAVRNQLRVLFSLGLFDDPPRDVPSPEVIECEAHRHLALEASRRSIVLLKNRENTLPLDASRLKKVAVIGPNADETAFVHTHYGPLATEAVSVYEGLSRALDGKVEVVYAKGCELVDANWPISEILPSDPDETEARMIRQAVDVAQQSDVVIAVVGGGTRTCGENKSRTSLDLPGHQELLLREVHKTGKPLIVILINGRPLSINWAAAHADAILEAWYPGSHGGTALAEVLLGDYNPGGKLTVTFPKTVGQIPFNFPAKPNSQIDGPRKPGLDGNQSRINGALYDFGFGLSYTTFSYSNLVLSRKEIRPDESFDVSFDVSNTGSRRGDEVVQLYIHDCLSSITVYEKLLKGFERVALEPGETKRVTMRLTPKDLSLLDANMHRVVEPGEFEIMIGASSTDIRLSDKVVVMDPTGQSDVPAMTVSVEFPVTLERGEDLTLPVREDRDIGELGIRWGKGTDCAFEILVSDGGGQFLPVFAGKASSGKLQRCEFDPVKASEIRLLITRGKAVVADLESELIRK